MNQKQWIKDAKERLKSEGKSKMNERIQMNNQSEIELLKNFINENKELEKLESITDKFNIFRSLDIVSNELKHSNFLAWLLDPNETHGLGDYFLTAFLKKASSLTELEDNESPSIFEIDSWNFNYIEILREWRNVDILIKSDENKFVCVIENKINSSESKGQLRKYRSIIENEFPNYKKLFVFLTLEGEIPSDEIYFQMTYKDILSILNYLIDAKNDELGKDILVFISHYRDMLGRYVLEDSKIQEICKSIYKKHKKALDLIFEYKPDLLMEIKEYLELILKQDNELIVDYLSKSYIRFISKNLDFIPKEGEGWTKSKRILLFEIKNYYDGVGLYLIIGPGPDDIRKKIYNIVKENSKIFNTVNRKFSEKFFSIYKKKWVSKKNLEDLDITEIRKIIDKKFESFKKENLPKIEEEIKKFNVV